MIDAKLKDEIDLIEHNLLNVAKRYANGNTEVESVETIKHNVMKAVTVGRVSVLQDFDAVCMADAFIGFSTEEFAAVKKFFAFNKSISGNNW